MRRGSQSRRVLAWLFVLGGVELTALTALALHDGVNISVLLLSYAIAFGAYVGVVLVLRRFALSVWIVLALGLFLRLPWIPTVPTLSDDVWRYLHDGRAQLAGVNPYRHPPASPEAAAYAGPEHSLINHPELLTVYPPGAELTFFAAAVIEPHLLTWKIVLLIFELILAAGIVQWLRARKLDAGQVAVYLLHPLPVIEFAGNGHVDAIAIATLVLALAFLTRPRPIEAGVALAFSIASKYLAVPIAAFAARNLIGRKRALFLSAGFTALILLYIPYATVIPIGSLGTFARTFEFNGSLYPLLSTALSPMTTRAVFGFLLVGILIVLWGKNASTEGAAFVWIAAVLMLSPIVHPWYLTWLIPFLAWRREAWVLAWTGTIVLTYTVLPEWQANGRWELPGWVPWAEYLPVATLLAWRVTGTWRGASGRPG